MVFAVLSCGGFAVWERDSVSGPRLRWVAYSGSATVLGCGVFAVWERDRPRLRRVCKTRIRSWWVATVFCHWCFSPISPPQARTLTLPVDGFPMLPAASEDRLRSRWATSPCSAPQARTAYALALPVGDFPMLPAASEDARALALPVGGFPMLCPQARTANALALPVGVFTLRPNALALYQFSPFTFPLSSFFFHLSSFIFLLSSFLFHLSSTRDADSSSAIFHSPSPSHLTTQKAVNHFSGLPLIRRTKRILVYLMMFEINFACNDSYDSDCSYN